MNELRRHDVDGLDWHVDRSIATISPARTRCKLIIRLTKQTEKVQLGHVLVETPLKRSHED